MVVVWSLSASSAVSEASGSSSSCVHRSASPHQVTFVLTFPAVCACPVPPFFIAPEPFSSSVLVSLFTFSALQLWPVDHGV